MQHFFFADQLARGVVKHYRMVIGLWVLAVLASVTLAPDWSDIALDGDFDHLPAGLPSVEGEKLLDEAFPGVRSRSQAVVVISRPEQTLSRQDLDVAQDISRRLYHKLGVAKFQRAARSGWQPGAPPEPGSDAAKWLSDAAEAFNLAISLDAELFQIAGDRLSARRPTPYEPRIAIAYRDRYELQMALGQLPDVPAETADGAAQVPDDLKVARELYPDIDEIPSMLERDEEPLLAVMIDVLSPEDRIFSDKLSTPQARLIRIDFATDLTSVRNIPAIEQIREIVGDARGFTGELAEPGLNVGVTGSAAIGADTKIASDEAIRYTELLTVLLILVILAVVYRAPLLVAIPLISIGIAVVTSMALVAGLVVAGHASGGWVPVLEVFTTSQIFVVVLVFGAGTDFCLFVIARVREEAGNKDWPTAISHSMGRTTSALVGSALTTVVGLSTMWLAEFGKFHYTGPVIAICLLVTLTTCLTLTPALLRAAGPRVFWPGRVPDHEDPPSRAWRRAAHVVTHYPVAVLVLGWILLLIPATYGWIERNYVSHDLVAQLSRNAGSRQAMEQLERHFNVGETNPMSLLLVTDEELSEEELQAESRKLADRLYLEGVASVRSLVDPLGDYPPGTRVGLFDRNAWRRRTLASHRITRDYYTSDVPGFAGSLLRLDVVPEAEPFGPEAAATLRRVRAEVEQLVSQSEGVWSGASFGLIGTTASIQDLREVTAEDTYHIQISVVIAVGLVLIVVLRRVLLSVYLILTVLLSYFATLGLTHLTFWLVDGEDFQGLDWKVPLFLFVILVAVGQDYNVYLVTRALEERHTHGRLKGLQRALARTGGIITSCGVVMAGTFLSMTAAAWLPPLFEALGLVDPESRPASLQALTQLGFSLGLGVLIDTFYVRPVLVPAAMAFWARWGFGREREQGESAEVPAATDD